LYEYLKDGLKYTRAAQDEDALEGYVDAYYADIVNTRKSISSFVFSLYGTIISWKTNQQPMMALFTTQAEYIVPVEGMKEAMWLKATTVELGVTQVCVKMHYDNKSVIHLMNHQVYHVRGKYIDIHLHFIRDMIE